MNLINYLEGKKTNITAFLMAIFNFLNGMGWANIDEAQILSINGVFIALIGLFVRRGVKNEAQKIINNRK